MSILLVLIFVMLHKSNILVGVDYNGPILSPGGLAGDKTMGPNGVQ